MTVVAVVFFPLVLLYQGWTYHVFRRRLQLDPSGRRSRRSRGRRSTAPRRSRDTEQALTGCAPSTHGCCGERGRSAVALGVDVALGLAATALLLAQAVIVATLVAAAFDGRPRRAQTGPCSSPSSSSSPSGRRSPDRPRRSGAGRPAASCPTCGWRSCVPGWRRRRGGADDDAGSRGARDRGGRRRRRARGLPRALPAPGRAVGHGAGRGARHRAGGRPAVRGDHAGHAAGDPRVHGAGRPARPGPRARERWEALARLSDHVLDVVRGLPTLRAYNRADAQAELVAASGERYRRGTMQVLRLSFLSGAVLDLAATLGTALVAVTVGVRLDRRRRSTLRAALIVLLLTPELYAPLRALGQPLPRQHRRRWPRPGASSTCSAPSTRRRRPAGARSGRLAAGRARPASPWSTRTAAGAVLHELDLELRRGEVVVADRAQRGRQEHRRRPAARAALVRTRGCRHRRRPATSRTLDLGRWRRQIGWLPQRPTMFRGTVRDNIALGDPAALGRAGAEAAAGWPGSAESSRSCGAATTP